MSDIIKNSLGEHQSRRQGVPVFAVDQDIAVTVYPNESEQFESPEIPFSGLGMASLKFIKMIGQEKKDMGPGDNEVYTIDDAGVVSVRKEAEVIDEDYFDVTATYITPTQVANYGKLNSNLWLEGKSEGFSAQIEDLEPLVPDDRKDLRNLIAFTWQHKGTDKPRPLYVKHSPHILKSLRLNVTTGGEAK